MIKFMFSLVFLVLCTTSNFVLAQEENAAINKVNIERNLESPLKSCCSLKLTTDKSVYLPGEAINARFTLENISSKPAYVDSNLIPEQGNIGLLKSNDEKVYKRYVGGDWGMRGSYMVGTPIFPKGAKVSQQADITYMSYIDAYKYSLDNRLSSLFLFEEPGTYWIKALFFNNFNEIKEQIESLPIKIRVIAPQGDDLLIWNTIKENKDLINFLINPDLGGTPANEAKLIVQTLEDLVEAYPKSRYVPQIKKALKEFEPFRKEYGLD